MKLEDQVLSIVQIKELKKLEFNVEKYASMCWLAYTSDTPPYEKEYYLCTHDIYCYESASLEPIPTLSVGDIIGILQERIQKKYYLEINKNNGKIQEKFIDKLFEILKLCIRLNNIAL